MHTTFSASNIKKKGEKKFPKSPGAVSFTLVGPKLFLGAEQSVAVPPSERRCGERHLARSAKSVPECEAKQTQLWFS